MKINTAETGTPKGVDKMNVPFELIRDADNMAKETGLSFRDCLDILVTAYLQEMQPIPARGAQTEPQRACIGCSL